jgi:hypothetical protein
VASTPRPDRAPPDACAEGEVVPVQGEGLVASAGVSSA